MAVKGFSALNARLDKLTKEILSDEANKRLAVAIGEMGKDNAHAAGGKASLGGDWKFSGWRKIEEPLGIAYSLHRGAPGVTIHRNRETAGPWRVAEEGRNRGNAGGIAGPGVIQSGANAGTTARNKNGGIRKVRARKGRRWNGTTSGHGSWTAYEQVVVPKITPLVDREVRAALSRGVIG